MFDVQRIFLSRLQSLSSSRVEFSRYLAYPPSAGIVLSMSAEDFRIVGDSCDEYLFRRKSTSIQPFRQECIVRGDTFFGSVPPPSIVPPSGDLNAIPVNVTEDTDKFCSFRNILRFAAMHEYRASIDFNYTRCGRGHATALATCKNYVYCSVKFAPGFLVPTNCPAIFRTFKVLRSFRTSRMFVDIRPFAEWHSRSIP